MGIVCTVCGIRLWIISLPDIFFPRQGIGGVKKSHFCFSVCFFEPYLIQNYPHFLLNFL